MALTVTVIPATPTAVDVVASHTVGIERAANLDPAIRASRAVLANARAVVVERYNGQVVKVIAADNALVPRRTLNAVAAEYARDWDAILMPADWPECPWCGVPDNRCPTLSHHLMLGAGREQTWREPRGAAVSVPR